MFNLSATILPICLPFEPCSLEIVITKPALDSLIVSNVSGLLSSTLTIFLKNVTVNVKMTNIEMKSAIGAAYKIPFIPAPTSLLSNKLVKINTNGVKHKMSLTNEATTARIDLPIDWKNTAVIFTKHVIVINDK